MFVLPAKLLLASEGQKATTDLQLPLRQSEKEESATRPSSTCRGADLSPLAGILRRFLTGGVFPVLRQLS
jgi:hypothetical protein